MMSHFELSSRAALCRQLAKREPNSRALWLAEAERWSRLAQNDIASHYEDCNLIQTSDAASRSKVAA
jgi:hypothetical protein